MIAVGMTETVLPKHQIVRQATVLYLDRVNCVLQDNAGPDRRFRPGLRNGDVVVARIGEEITLKRYYRQNGYGSIELQPVSSNAEHNTIRIDGRSDFEISGVVVGAIIGTRRE